MLNSKLIFLTATYPASQELCRLNSRKLLQIIP